MLAARQGERHPDPTPGSEAPADGRRGRLRSASVCSRCVSAGSHRPVRADTGRVMTARDARFLAAATPALTAVTIVLRARGRPGLLRTSQREFLDRCGPWAAPALGAWMVAATALTGVLPLLLTGRHAGERAARPAVRPIASLLGAQVVLEGALGALSDKSHPLTGAAFSLYRLRQIRRARAADTVDRAPRVGRLLGVQALFLRANVCMLLATVVARTVMRPGR